VDPRLGAAVPTGAHGPLTHADSTAATS
jgi:hypothetical protein